MMYRNLKSQVKNDLTLIRRDSFLRVMIFVPLFASLVFRFAFPLIMENVDFGIDLDIYIDLMVSFVFILVMPSLLGMITGFLLLDEKDEGTLMVLQISPVQPQKYLATRMIFPVSLGIVSNLLALAIVGNFPPFGLLFFVVVMGSIWAPIFALLLPTFANNKVEGFALVKLLGTVFLVPIIAFFIPTPWQFGIGIIPAYWPVKLFWMISSTNINFVNLIIAFIIGFTLNIGLVILVLKNFNKKTFVN